MPRQIEPYEYPGHYRVRRVSRCGTIRVLKQQVFVSNTLAEAEVGPEEVDDGVYDLYFCFYQIGRYHLQGNRIEDIVTRVPVTRRQIDLARRVLPMSWERSVTYVVTSHPRGGLTTRCLPGSHTVPVSCGRPRKPTRLAGDNAVVPCLPSCPRMKAMRLSRRAASHKEHDTP